ncbi:MAG: hypothetical protein QM602_04325 [Microbacterium sp.]
MNEVHDGLEVVAFENVARLRAWLEEVGTTHPGVWVRLQRAKSTRPSVTFHDLLVEGIAYGWSESTRHAYDDQSYLQRFSPRRARGTASERNRRIADKLEEAGRMTAAGRSALGL